MEYLAEIPMAIRYPLRGEGPKVAIGGGLALGLVFAVGEANALGYLLGAPVWGYLFAYWLDLLRRNAAGRDDPPPSPEPRDIPGTFVIPLTIFIALLLAAYGPALLILGIGVALPGLAGVSRLLGGLLGIAGFFVFPMVLLAYAVSGSLRRAVDYAGLYRSAGRVLPIYIITVLLFGIADALGAFVFVFLAFGTSLFLQAVPFFGRAISYSLMWIAVGYLLQAQFYLLGRLHHHHREALRLRAPLQ